MTHVVPGDTLGLNGPSLVLWPWSRALHSLIEEQVGVGGQHLLEGGLAHGVIRHPEPVGTEGRGATGGGGAAAVCHKVSRVHVPMMDQHSHQPEEVHRRAVEAQVSGQATRQNSPKSTLTEESTLLIRE